MAEFVVHFRIAPMIIEAIDEDAAIEEAYNQLDIQDAEVDSVELT